MSIDLDDVISIVGRPYAAMIKLGASLMVREGYLYNSPRRFKDYLLLMSKAQELSSSMVGASNLFYTAAQSLKKEGYTDFTDYLDEIVEHAIDPYSFITSVSSL